MSQGSSSSLSALTSWLRIIRKTDSRPLDELLPSRSFAPQDLLELVGIDLIESHRHGRTARVESYLTAFPELAENVEFVLDLIDAEVCVRRELGDRVTLEELQSRFPALAERLTRLVDLDAVEQNLIALAQPHHQMEVNEDNNSSFALSVNPSLIDIAKPRRTLEFDGESLEPPEGVRVLQLASSRPGVQLYRALDEADRRPLALKVIRQSATDRMPASAWLDRLELTAQFTHPRIANAESVIANHHHFVVLRPWIEGTCWSTWSNRSLPMNTLMRPIIALGETLQVLHNAGLPHGHVHPGNLLIDHQQNLWLVDLGSSAFSSHAQTWRPIHDDPRSSDANCWVLRDRFALLTLAVMALDGQPLESRSKYKRIRDLLDNLRSRLSETTAESIAAMLRDALDGRSRHQAGSIWSFPWWRSRLGLGESS